MKQGKDPGGCMVLGRQQDLPYCLLKNTVAHSSGAMQSLPTLNEDNDLRPKGQVAEGQKGNVAVSVTVREGTTARENTCNTQGAYLQSGTHAQHSAQLQLPA